jgi:hypothetical protein
MVKVTAAKAAACACIPGMLESIVEQTFDETQFPPEQCAFWLGFLAAVAWTNNPEVAAKWPTLEDGVTPDLRPSTIKFGLLRG